MKTLQSVVLIVVLILCTQFDVKAQETVNLVYSLNFSEANYSTMQSRHSESGISGRDFGRWLADNGAFSMKMDGNAEGSDQSDLVLLKINDRGNILAEQRITLKSPEFESGLNRVVNSNDIVSAFDAFIPTVDSWAPSETFIPNTDNWFPTNTFVTVVDGYRRMAVDVSQRAFRESRISSDGVAIVLIAIPDRNMNVDSRSRITPGGAVFVGTSSIKRPEME